MFLFLIPSAAGALFLPAMFAHSPCLCACYPLISRFDHSPSSHPSVRSILVSPSDPGIMQTLPVFDAFRQTHNVSTHSHQRHRELAHLFSYFGAIQRSILTLLY
ncbi:hypothetical protein BJX96DRAFT_147182 [Aspergillus floccosus]